MFFISALHKKKILVAVPICSRKYFKKIQQKKLNQN